MTDFWFSVVITMCVTLITILAEWFVDSFIVQAMTISNLKKSIDKGFNTADVEKEMKEEYQRFENSKVNKNVWGSDLATVTIALDFTALGIWIYNKAFFPFLLQFNDGTIDRTIYVWLVIFLIHFVLFFITIIAKHKHFKNPNNYAVETLPPFFSKDGWNLYKWKISTNSLGFLILLSGIVIYTNSI